MPHKAVKQKPSGWKNALEDARCQLDAAKKRVKELTIAVRVCEERVESGDPFPGEQLRAAD